MLEKNIFVDATKTHDRQIQQLNSRIKCANCGDNRIGNYCECIARLS